jgi:sugar phosphate permease
MSRSSSLLIFNFLRGNKEEASAQTNTVEQKNKVLDRVISKAGWRLVPVLIVMYMLSYLDRVNIGFAKRNFQASTGVTEIAFAFGASIFFIGYALFEFPSNLSSSGLARR